MNIFRNCLLILSSIFISVLFIELILTIFFPQAKNGSWRVQNDDGVYLNKNNGTAKHEFFGSKEQVSVTYQFGEYNNRVILDDIYSQNKNRVLVLGDSNVFGWLLDDQDLFITKLQQSYSNYYFINASAGGFSDADMYLYLKRYCKTINPKFILFFIDVDRVIRKQSLDINNKNKLIIKKNEINKFKEFLNEKRFYNYLIQNSNLFQFIKKIYIMSTGSYIDYIDKKNYNKSIKQKNSINTKKNDDVKKNNEDIQFNIEKSLLKKLFNNIKIESDKCKSEIIFIDIALFTKEATSKTRNYVIDNFEEMFENRNKINFVSLYNEMTEYRKNKPAFDLEEGHPNSKGNEIIYKSLKKEIKNFISIK